MCGRAFCDNRLPMSASFRPRRSFLYMPGSNPRAKESARTIVAAALAAGGYGARELVLRVNALDTPWGHADIAAAAAMPIDAVLLPKVESADRVRLTASLLDALGAPERLALWCMIETPLGILKAH